MSKIDPKGIQSTNIESYDYSKMADLKRDLKIKALLAARDKATYLLAALGEKVGSPINITESDNSSFPQPRVYANTMMFKASADSNVGDSDISFKTIKLNFQIQAVFEIVK
jgi:uncharacterized protein YggE